MVPSFLFCSNCLLSPMLAQKMSNVDGDDDDAGEESLKPEKTPAHFQNFLATTRANLETYSRLGLAKSPLSTNNKFLLDTLSLIWSKGFFVTYDIDPRTLAQMVSLKPGMTKTFQMGLDPSIFQLSGITVLFVDLNIVKPFWKKWGADKLTCPDCKRESLTSGGWSPTLRRVAYSGGLNGSYGALYIASQRMRCEKCPNAKGKAQSRNFNAFQLFDQLIPAGRAFFDIEVTPKGIVTRGLIDELQRASVGGQTFADFERTLIERRNDWMLSRMHLFYQIAAMRKEIIETVARGLPPGMSDSSASGLDPTVPPSFFTNSGGIQGLDFLAWIPSAKYLSEIYVKAMNTKEMGASDSIVDFQRKHMSQLGGTFVANDDNFQLTKRVKGPYAAMNTTENEYGQVLACWMIPNGSHESLKGPFKLFSERRIFVDLQKVR